MPDGNKKYTVIIQETTTEMLVQHARFLAQVNENAAKRLVTEFKKKTTSLESSPERCPWLLDPIIPERKYRKLIFEKRYILIFQIIGRKVYVDAMVDSRQDYMHLL
jgi:hypothetical protein